VGRLQFDVVEARLQQEYGVKVSIEPLPFNRARWLVDSTVDENGVNWPFNGVLRAKDRRERSVCLFSSQWILDHFIEKNPGLALSETG
jgi:peptide chain release factor 3